MAKTFLDTNIIVYANDAAAGEKRDRALDLVTEHMSAGTGAISTQVCMEYASVALSKLKQAPSAVERQLALLDLLEMVQVETNLIVAGIQLMAAYSLSFWDAMIAAAAQAAHCQELLSEDLTEGQMYGPVRVVNPFR